MKGRRKCRGGLILVGILLAAGLALAMPLAATPATQRWHYRTIANTTFLDDCAICDRLPMYVPVNGGFDLARVASDPLFDHYQIENLYLADSATSPSLEITGQGTMDIGGEVAIVQRWRWDLDVKTPAGSRSVTFTNEAMAVERQWPMLQASLAEAGGSSTSRFFLNLAAAPFRELWFNTLHNLTSGLGQWPSNRLTAADVLSESGRLVHPGLDLLAAAGLPAETTASVDAFVVLPGGEMIFSLSASAKSETLGPLQEGDLISSHGHRLKANQEFTAQFTVMPPVPDLGLDAIHLLDTGEWLFSIRTPAFSERLGKPLGRGDILGSLGRIMCSNHQLLSRFNPPHSDHDYGLDAFYLWPSGEIWFSPEEGFQDARLGPITDGDLLSDQGYLVRRNLDLVREFQPLEDLANFGLEGLFVVSDMALSPGTTGTRMTISVLSTGAWSLAWESRGRAFQVEATDRLGDSFMPVSPLIPESQWTVQAGPATVNARFFRVRTW